MRRTPMLVLLALGPALALAQAKETARPDARSAAVKRFDAQGGFLGARNFMLQGHVAKVSRDAIVVRRDGLPEAKLRLAAGTRIRLDEADVAPTELREGQEVRATFNVEGSTPLAIEIQAASTDGREPYEGGTDRIRPPPQDWKVPYEETDPGSPKAEPPGGKR